MRMRRIKQLHSGDEVFWADPDNGTCSRNLTVCEIEIIGDVVRILDTDGNSLECFARELS